MYTDTLFLNIVCEYKTYLCLQDSLIPGILERQEYSLPWQCILVYPVVADVKCVERNTLDNDSSDLTVIKIRTSEILR